MGPWAPTIYSCSPQAANTLGALPTLSFNEASSGFLECHISPVQNVWGESPPTPPPQAASYPLRGQPWWHLGSRHLLQANSSTWIHTLRCLSWMFMWSVRRVFFLLVVLGSRQTRDLGLTSCSTQEKCTLSALHKTSGKPDVSPWIFMVSQFLLLIIHHTSSCLPIKKDCRVRWGTGKRPSPPPGPCALTRQMGSHMPCCTTLRKIIKRTVLEFFVTSLDYFNKPQGEPSRKKHCFSSPTSKRNIWLFLLLLGQKSLLN